MKKNLYKMINRCCLYVILFLFSDSVICADSFKSDSDFKNTISKSSDFIKKTMKENEIVGLSIALVYDNKIVWAEGFGWADKEKKIPAETETIYMLGSGSKTVATVALLQYLDKGYVSLEDSVSKHLIEFKMLDRFKDQSEEMTVRRLLNHHSGIPGDLFNNMGVEKAWNECDSDLYIDWLLDYLKADYPSYAPGEIAIYCNTGFILVGELIKKLSKDKNMTFNEIMAKNLLQPLNMTSSSFDIIKKNLAKGYIDGKEKPPIQFNEIAGATGGLFTNVEDMSKFLIMLLNDGKIPNGERILKSQTVSMMGDSEVSALDVNSCFITGLGLDSVSDSALSYAGRAWIKDGSTGNFNSIMGLLPDKKLGVIILTNSDTSELLKYSIMRECLKNALQEKFKLKPVEPKYPDWTSISDPDKLVGKYVYSSGYDEIIRGNEKNSLLWKRHILNGKPDSKKIKFNGKRYSVDDGTEEIVFKNIEGHFLMIQYGASGSDIDKYMYNNYVIKIIAEKTELPVISDAWRKLVGKVYLIDNMSWNNLGWDRKLTFSILEKQGCLLVAQGEEQALIVPQNKTVAFVQGLNNRGDSSLRFLKDEKTERVFYSSFTAFDLKNIVELSKDDIVKKQSLPFPKTAWYKYKTDKNGEEISFRIREGERKYKIQLFNRDFKLVKDGADVICWNSEKGSWYLAVSPFPGKNEPFTLKISSK